MTNGTGKVLEVLKKMLKSQGMTYRSLAKELSLSEPSVKRLFATKSLSFERFADICTILGIGMLEVVRMAEQQDDVSPTLTYEQEDALAANAKLLVLFNLLLRQWTVAEIMQKYDYSPTEITRLLVELDKLRCIDLHAKNRVKVLVSVHLDWIPGGPIRKLYEKQVQLDFLNHAFGNKTDRLKFVSCEVSESTMKLIFTKLDRLAAEIADLGMIDGQLPKEETRSMAFLMGARPWVFDLMEQFKKKKKK